MIVNNKSISIFGRSFFSPIVENTRVQQAQSEDHQSSPPPTAPQRPRSILRSGSRSVTQRDALASENAVSLSAQDRRARHRVVFVDERNTTGHVYQSDPQLQESELIVNDHLPEPLIGAALEEYQYAQGMVHAANEAMEALKPKSNHVMTSVVTTPAFYRSAETLNAAFSALSAADRALSAAKELAPRRPQMAAYTARIVKEVVGMAIECAEVTLLGIQAMEHQRNHQGELIDHRAVKGIYSAMKRANARISHLMKELNSSCKSVAELNHGPVKKLMDEARNTQTAANFAIFSVKGSLGIILSMYAEGMRAHLSQFSQKLNALRYRINSAMAIKSNQNSAAK